MYFFFFYQKTGFDTSCKLSPKETICIKFQIPLSGENKNISVRRPLKKMLRVLSIKLISSVEQYELVRELEQELRQAGH